MTKRCQDLCDDGPKICRKRFEGVSDLHLHAQLFVDFSFFFYTDLQIANLVNDAFYSG